LALHKTIDYTFVVVLTDNNGFRDAPREVSDVAGYSGQVVDD